LAWGLSTPPWGKTASKTYEGTVGRIILQRDGKSLYEIRRLTEASEEGQGPHRTVEPMMMMMMMMMTTTTIMMSLSYRVSTCTIIGIFVSLS
jgi:hypothetical protein